MITMSSKHKTQADKEERLLTYLSKKPKTEFEKLLEEAEKKKVPKPKPSEKKKDFMLRCIPILIQEGKKTEQAIAQCSSLFENRNKYTTDTEQ